MAFASDVQASLKAHPTGLQHLPPSVLGKILFLTVEEAAVDGQHSTPAPDPAWQESFLVPLRTLARGLRDAVDLCLTSRSLYVRPEGPRDIASLFRFSNCLRRCPSRWPHLTTLSLNFDWPAEYLQFALLEIVRSCPLLARLKLSVPPRGLSRIPEADDSGPVDIGALGSLASLTALSLENFVRYPRWSEALFTLTAIQELALISPGIRVFESWPLLMSLTIDDTGPPDVDWEDASNYLLLSPSGLRHLSIANMWLDALTVPETLESLELQTTRFTGTWDFVDSLPALRCFRANEVNHDFVEALLATVSGLTTLEVRKVGGEEPPSLEHLESLKSLVWDGNYYTGISPSISTLTALEELVLSEVVSLVRFPSLDALTGLRKLSLEGAGHLLQAWPQLTTLTGLVTLKLSGGGAPGQPRSYFIGLGALDVTMLVALEELTLEGLWGSAVPEMGTLTRLKRLTLDKCNGLSTVEGLEELTSLEVLRLSGMEDLWTIESLPISLTSLCVTNCTGLLRFPSLPPESRLCELILEHTSSVLVAQLPALPSLRKLHIRNFPNLHSLPRLSYLKSLRSLKISTCPLLRVVDVRPLVVLQHLHVANCVQLESVKGLCKQVKCITTSCDRLQSFNV